MRGNMRHTMRQHIEAADFVILIGTPLLKKKTTQDRLLLLPYFDFKLVPDTGNIIALVESRNFYAIYYFEEGILKETITAPLDLKIIPWQSRANHVQEARISQKTNELLESIFDRLKSREHHFVSNVQFELGVITDHMNLDSKILIPLIFKGDHQSAFPSVIQHNLIRDLRSEDHYYTQMSTLMNPPGIIVAIWPSLIRNAEYIQLANQLHKDLRAEDHKS
jgi:hypothetical protein